MENTMAEKSLKALVLKYCPWVFAGLVTGVLVLKLGVLSPLVLVLLLLGGVMVFKVDAAMFMFMALLPYLWIMRLWAVVGVFLTVSIVFYMVINRRQVYIAWEHILLLGFYGSVLISIATMPEQFQYLQSFTQETNLTPLIANQYTFLIILFFFVSTYVDSTRRLKIAVWGLVAGCLFLALQGLLQGILSLPNLPLPIAQVQLGATRFEQASGLSKSAHDYSFYIQTAGFLLYPLIVLESDARRKRLLAAAFMVLLIGWAYGGSRTSYVTVALVVLLAIKQHLRVQDLKWFFGLIVAASLLSGGLFYDTILTIVDDLLLTQGSMAGSLGAKLMIAVAAFKTWMMYPLTGVGLGNSVIASKPLWPAYLQSVHHVVHTGYLVVALEMGALGLFFFLSTVVLTMVGLQRARVRARHAGHREFYLVSSGVIYALMGLLIVNTIYPAEIHKALWVILALAVSAKRVYSLKERSAKPGGDPEDGEDGDD